MLDRGIRAPETDLECAPGRLQVGRRDQAEGQGFAGGVGEVVERPEPLEEVADLLLAAKIQRVARGVVGQIGERRVDALAVARGNDDRRALGRGELGCREADPRGSAEDDDLLRVELHVVHRAGPRTASSKTSSGGLDTVTASAGGRDGR